MTSGALTLGPLLHHGQPPSRVRNHSPPHDLSSQEQWVKRILINKLKLDSLVLNKVYGQLLIVQSTIICIQVSWKERGLKVGLILRANSSTSKSSTSTRGVWLVVANGFAERVQRFQWTSCVWLKSNVLTYH